MGHTRLGTIPTSKQWREVVAILEDSDERGGLGAGSPALASTVAAETLDAAAPALQRAYDDAGVRYTFFLLTQTVLAARHDDWIVRLAQHGISLNDRSSVFDLTAQLSYAIDDYVASTARPTDVSEMAQRAACEAITGFANSRTIPLFDAGGSELKDLLRAMSTQRGFSALGQAFFGGFTARFLNFYLSRITASSLGKGTLRSVGDITAFNTSLQTHCKESARIVRDFCGQWYSKTQYEQGINQQNVAQFMVIAFRKLGKEMSRQRERV